MKRLIVFLILLFPIHSFADEFRHIVSFGTHGLGWSAAVEQMETGSKSPFSDVDYWTNNIGINYGYRLNKRFVIGGHYQTSHSEYRFNKGGSSRVDRESEVIGLFGQYHFSDTISNTWYMGIGISYFTYTEETSHNISVAESKSPFELDDSGEIYELIIGRRFKMMRWHLEHLTYAPQIGIFAKDHGKDFDDQDVKKGYGASFQPIKFDFLF